MFRTILGLLLTAAAPAQDVVVYTEAKDLTLEGRAFEDAARPYDRLPADAEKVVREPVWRLSKQSAGIAVRFVTDAPTIQVRWKLDSAELAMQHMPATGVSGIDVYVRDGEQWRWVACPRPNSQEMEATVVRNAPVQEREYRVYFPLYNGVESLAIGVTAPHVVRAAPKADDHKRVVFYGTSITQGACASRPGMCHPAILGRRLDFEAINLGFSGNGRMELPVGERIARIDADVYVVDCLPNMNTKQVAERTVPLVRALREARPETPIVLVEDRTFANAFLYPSRMAAHAERRAALKAAFDQLVELGVKNLHYLPGEGLLGTDGDATVDGSHPTDLGFARQADHFEPLLGKLLGNR